ncbi:MAG: helix-turn-helix transcriptional regulator [Lachnospiraceae bacterium]|nr:helix-turn-helix transcriptional regulator [Lachnospiraceae bacterium]
MDLPILLWHNKLRNVDTKKGKLDTLIAKECRGKDVKILFDNHRAGKQIALLRKSRGITQEELGQRLSVSPQAVSKWENGHTMPEVSMLVELSQILGATIDEILLPTDMISANANFEHILLPYDEIADFSGIKWPRSMAWPAILSAIKLFMGLECRKDPSKRQMNDDTEYIFQSAFTSTCFGYSWGAEIFEKNCLAVYGLSCEVFDSEQYNAETLMHLATENILTGYPVVVESKEYEDIILASGFSHNGKVLKGISFLDGDDDKNSVMSFKQLHSFAGWYKKKIRLILIKPSADKVSVEDACKEALYDGCRLLSNEIHRFDQPLVGYGLVIYDNWRNELRVENEKNLETIECLYPHIFIHYENKMCIKRFLELCIHTVSRIDRESLETAIAKYGELIDIFEKALHDWLTETPKDIAAAKSIRQGFDYILRRSRELETEALDSWATAIKMGRAEDIL